MIESFSSLTTLLSDRQMKLLHVGVMLLLCLGIGNDGAWARIQTPLEKQMENGSRDNTLQRRREMLAEVVKELKGNAAENERELEQLKLENKKLKLELKKLRDAQS